MCFISPENDQESSRIKLKMGLLLIYFIVVIAVTFCIHFDILLHGIPNKLYYSRILHV